jgi:hypothetical protein
MQIVPLVAAAVLPAEAGAACGASHSGQGHIHAGEDVSACADLPVDAQALLALPDSCWEYCNALV